TSLPRSWRLSASVLAPLPPARCARWLSGTPGQLDAQVVANVDLCVIGQPGTGGHLLEHRYQPAADALVEGEETPPAPRLRLRVPDRVLDVEQRLPGARVQRCPVRAGELGHAEEGDLLLCVVEEGTFHDQLVPLLVQPQPLHRAPVQVVPVAAVMPLPG